jgi:ABC-type spermidine/putrescine transport system permease subunit I
MEMHPDAHFGRIPAVSALVFVLIPSTLVIFEILIIGASQWNMGTRSLVHFPTSASLAVAWGSGRSVFLRQQIARAMTVATLDILIAAPAAHFLVRRVRRERGLVALWLLLLPFFINSATRAFSWKVLLGSHGPLNVFLTHLWVSDAAQTSLHHSPVGAILCLVSASLPLALFSIAGFMSAIPESVWDLCDDDGLDCTNELMLVALPLSLNGIKLGWIASFVICALASNEIDFTGGIHDVSLFKVIQDLFTVPDPASATAMGILLSVGIAGTIGIVLFALWCVNRIRIVRRLPLGSAGICIERCCLGLAFVIVLIPVATILLQTASLAIHSSSAARGGAGKLLSDTVIAALGHTLWVAIGVTFPTLIGAILVGLSWWNARLFHFLSISSLCLAAIPGGSYAMGVYYMLQTLHLSLPPVLIISITEYVWVFPFMLLTVVSGYSRIPTSTVEAARDLGASWSRTFLSIILPVCWPEMVLSGLVGVVLASNDASRPSLLANEYELISEYIAARLQSGNNLSDHFLASFSVLLGLLVVSSFVSCFFYLHSDHSPKEEQGGNGHGATVSGINAFGGRI